MAWQVGNGRKLRVGEDPWIGCNQDIRIMLGWPSTLGPRTRDHFFSQFWKLGFFWVSECENFSHRGEHEGDCRSSSPEKILVANDYCMCSCGELCYLLWGIEIDLFPIIVKKEIFFVFVLIKAKGVVNLYEEVNWY